MGNRKAPVDFLCGILDRRAILQYLQPRAYWNLEISLGGKAPEVPFPPKKAKLLCNYTMQCLGQLSRHVPQLSHLS